MAAKKNQERSGAGMDKEAVAVESVRQFVWSGFYDADGIVEMIDEAVLSPGELDHGWLRARIEEEFRKKRADELAWPAITDCDRLDQVFELLEQQGILALQNAGYTQDNGLDDVTQFYHEAGGEQSGIGGYCFYHGQDLERVMENGDLHLTYGDIRGDDEKGIEIGRRIKRALETAGFTVVWDEAIKTRLLVLLR
ncbi:DUF6891 domain-containing protein [Limnoglobus roseus]|nr:hypothetical protein [Limnoglobus roseus]